MSHEHATPTDLGQALDQIFLLVRIHSAESFSYSHASISVTTTPPRAIGTEETRRLVLALRDTLYARCYARAPGDALREATDGGGACLDATEDSIDAEEFARRLSTANRGREGWREGWRVESIGAGGVVVAARETERRVAWPGDYAPTFAEDVPPCVGCAVTLRVRKESLTVQEGVYCALGAESPHAHEETDAVRVYFNAPPSASLLLTEAATTHLNEWRAPFTLKVMLRPEDRDRRDTVVLYLPRDLRRVLFQLMEKLPARMLALLRPGVPLFTKPLCEGVGLAESPPSGESFGMHRCRLLAESIVDAWLDGRQDVEARWSAFERRFDAEGLSLARAYLNAGGEDVYEPAGEDAYEATPSASRVPTPSRAAESFGTLTRANVVAYLRARGLLVEGVEDLPVWRVTEHHSRNRNFAVTGTDGAQGFFVKQLRAQDPESLGMLRREARVYELASQDADFAALREVVPPFFGYDDAARATVLGALDGESLLQLHRRLGRFPLEIAEQLGRVLATAHLRVGRDAAANPPRGVFNLAAPGIFTAHRGGPLVRWLGPGQMLIVEQVRDNKRLARVLDELAATWQCDTFIHGDIKFENCIVAAGANGRGESSSDARPDIRLVDWELADFGEPAWDLGSMLQSYLALCLLDAPTAPRASLREQLRTSSANFDGMRRAVAAFWGTYREDVATDKSARKSLTERALFCASARLVQSALEVTHGQPRPTPGALSLLAASIEVITNTHEIARRLGLHD